MPDTVSPYDDEVVDPYADDPDVKNPHDEADPPDDDDEPTPAPRRRGRPRKDGT